MKQKLLLVTFLSVVAFTVGCNREQTASQQLDQLAADTKEAARDLKDYTFGQKGEYTSKMRTELAQMKSDLDALTIKVEGSSDAVKADAQPKLAALRVQTDELNEQLEKAENATESTWDSVKAGTRKSYDALKDGFQQSRQWISEKIAP